MKTLESIGTTDVNAVVGGYLRDLAYAQPTQSQMFGYKRAAAAIFRLEMSLIDLVCEHEDALPKIAGIGPGSARVIHEVLETGTSPTVERAIDVSLAKSSSPSDSSIARRHATMTFHLLARVKSHFTNLRGSSCVSGCWGRSHATSAPTRAPSRAVPRLRTL